MFLIQPVCDIITIFHTWSRIGFRGSFTVHLSLERWFHEIEEGVSRVLVTGPRAVWRRINTRGRLGARRRYEWTAVTAPGQRSAVEQPPARPARSWYIDLSPTLLPNLHTSSRPIFILCLKPARCFILQRVKVYSLRNVKSHNDWDLWIRKSAQHNAISLFQNFPG